MGSRLGILLNTAALTLWTPSARSPHGIIRSGGSSAGMSRVSGATLLKERPLPHKGRGIPAGTSESPSGTNGPGKSPRAQGVCIIWKRLRNVQSAVVVDGARVRPSA